MVFVPTTFVEKVVPTNIVGTKVHNNSLKIGQITKPCQRFLRGNEQKIYSGYKWPPSQNAKTKMSIL